MDYIDLDGNKIENTTSQDKFLEFLYTNMFGRILLKPLVRPCLSRLAGKALSTQLSTLIVPTFIKNNQIDMSSYANQTYHSFNDFFTRKINEGFRPLSGGDETLISPCDCKATVYKIRKNTIFSVKNTEYTLRSLLRSKRLAERFKDGYAFILRLTVDDYHRYIYAASGAQSKNYHIDGTFHTVNPIANDYLPIYKENTREYTVIHSEKLGQLVQMEVGALMVGKISNHKESDDVTRGEEKGFFEYGGSTIIVLVQNNNVCVRPDLLKNTLDGYETKLLQGQALGYATSSPKA